MSAPPPGRKCDRPTQKFFESVTSNPCRRSGTMLLWLAASYGLASPILVTFMFVSLSYFSFWSNAALDAIAALRIRDRHDARDAPVAPHPAPRKRRDGNSL